MLLFEQVTLEEFRLCFVAKIQKVYLEIRILEMRTFIFDARDWSCFGYSKLSKFYLIGLEIIRNEPIEIRNSYSKKNCVKAYLLDFIGQQVFRRVFE